MYEMHSYFSRKVKYEVLLLQSWFYHHILGHHSTIKSAVEWYNLPRLDQDLDRRIN